MHRIITFAIFVAVLCFADAEKELPNKGKKGGRPNFFGGWELDECFSSGPVNIGYQYFAASPRRYLFTTVIFGDSQCTNITGYIEEDCGLDIQGYSSTVPGAWNIGYRRTPCRIMATILDQSLLDLFTSPNCVVPQLNTPFNLNNWICPDLGYEPPHVCPETYDIVKVENGSLFFGNISGNELPCAEADRATDFNPSAFTRAEKPRESYGPYPFPPQPLILPAALLQPVEEAEANNNGLHPASPLIEEEDMPQEEEKQEVKSWGGNRAVKSRSIVMGLAGFVAMSMVAVGVVVYYMRHTIRGYELLR